MGLDLVARGHAVAADFDHSLSACRAYQRYYKQVLQAEKTATKKTVGVWQQGVGNTPSLLQRIKKRLFG